MTRRQDLINPSSVLRAVQESPSDAAGGFEKRREPRAPRSGTGADDPVSDSIEGRITGVFENAITGWAWDPERPYDSVELEVYSGSLKLGQARADRFDLELAKANMGNGLHRFELTLERLPPGTPPFKLRTVVAGTDIELNPSIVLPTLDDAERLLSSSEYLGRVTGIENGMICGWVVNRRNPHEAPQLTLVDGDAAILAQSARERISVVIEAGVTASAYAFQLPLSAGLLDGAQHRLSVLAGVPPRDLEGSPILFGPSDVTSVGRSLVSALEKLQRLERRVENVEPLADPAHFEKKLTAGILDRVDMLLNIHRDSLEREMAVMRRQLTRVLQYIPEMDADVIVPLTGAAAIEDETAPPSITFSAAHRATPRLTFDVSEYTNAITPTGGIKWPGLRGAGTGLQISGSGHIEFNEPIAAPASLMLSGEGAQDPLEFCTVMTALDSHPLIGRVDVSDANGWNFVGTTTDAGVAGLSGRGLTIEFLPGTAPPRTPLSLLTIAVFGHRRVPLHESPGGARASIVYLGMEQMGAGWHAVEAGRRGGICWMAGRSETVFHLRPSRSYRLMIPEIRPLVPDLMSRMHVTVGGARASLEITPLSNDPSAFSVSGQCSVPGEVREELTLEISFPKEFVRSPKERGLNNDERPLTIAVRAIALIAAD